MARRTISRGRFVRPSPKTKIWIGSGVGPTAVGAAAVILVSTLSAGALALRPFTILRTRQLITWETDQESADEQPMGAYGKIVVTSDAASIGATAIPDPDTISGNPDADWFVHQSLYESFETLSGAGFQSGMATQYVVDSHSMRKVGPNDDIASIVSEAGAFGAVLTTQGRMLIQLH